MKTSARDRYNRKKMNEITIFKNILDTSTPFHRGVEVILERIKIGKSKDLVSAIRKEKDKGKARKGKKRKGKARQDKGKARQGKEQGKARQQTVK